VRELNQNTSQVLARVRDGEVIEVTERGRPIARLVPVDGGLSMLERMARTGRAVPPRETGLIPLPPVLGDPAVSAADELLRAREEERR
jgi:prevent-host-death family protein